MRPNPHRMSLAFNCTAMAIGMLAHGYDPGHIVGVQKGTANVHRNWDRSLPTWKTRRAAAIARRGARRGRSGWKGEAKARKAAAGRK